MSALGRALRGTGARLISASRIVPQWGKQLLPGIRHWAILSVERTDDVLQGSDRGDITIRSLPWASLINFMPVARRAELNDYLGSKEQFSSRRPNKRLQPTAASQP